jgi:single-strand DNA-binding protein
MLNTTQITIVGNVGSDPELRFTPTGTEVLTFSVAVPQRKYNQDSRKWEDSGTTWYRINAWRGLAEHATQSLSKGVRVIVIGSLVSREWESDGKSGTSWEITADDIGASFMFATATIKRATRDAVPVPDDPWHGGNGTPEAESSNQVS